MKTIATILTLCIFGLTALVASDSQPQLKGSGNMTTSTRALTGFTGVSASGAIELIVTAQQDFKVEVEADDNIIEHVITKVDDGVLRIEMDDEYSYSNSDVTVRISLPSLTLLDISGASSALATNVHSDKLTIGVSGASKVTTEGSLKHLHGDISGASSLRAEKLTAERVTVEASGASNGYVNASQSLIAEASGASSIYYSGNPKNTEVETSGASSIKRR